MRMPNPLRWRLPGVGGGVGRAGNSAGDTGTNRGGGGGGGGDGAKVTVVATAGVSPPSLVAPSAPLNVVITGGTSGVGLALARAFLAAGDRVVLCARTADRVEAVVAALHREAAAADIAAASAAAPAGAAGDGAEASPPSSPPRRVWGTAADVADPAAVDALVAYATGVLPRLDVWINNAGTIGGTRAPLTTLAADEVVACVATNLTGSLLSCRAAAVAMGAQSPPGGLIYLMEGAGSAGGATAGYAAYGATKRALPQLAASLAKEFAAGGAVGAVGEPPTAGVRVALLSPGMVLTPLLLRGSTVSFRRFFNILAEEPATVADTLVPRVRSAALQGAGLGRGRAPAVRFLSGAAAVAQLVWGGLLGVRRGRYFDAKGRRVLRDGDTADDFDEMGVRVERL
ncbi:hypothetical protein MMPV_000326 [Pyropia vietnamensis]